MYSQNANFITDILKPISHSEKLPNRPQSAVSGSDVSVQILPAAWVPALADTYSDVLSAAARSLSPFSLRLSSTSCNNNRTHAGNLLRFRLCLRLLILVHHPVHRLYKRRLTPRIKPKCACRAPNTNDIPHNALPTQYTHAHAQAYPPPKFTLVDFRIVGKRERFLISLYSHHQQVPSCFACNSTVLGGFRSEKFVAASREKQHVFPFVESELVFASTQDFGSTDRHREKYNLRATEYMSRVSTFLFPAFSRNSV
ncbi:hypothetical protein EV702DRAFT_1046620 [Suillus placidus]|uniref:Uncharacterized protein n=1 Tax=Suillus placidus TaxID=48579 RepID=A0A9P6ZTJ3_9AGAM|nr:hypothetical protein EV702DRAFT_1046620 [Suillus placidus]